MKLKLEDLTILKNFALINNSIYIREGNIISSLSPEINIFAKFISQTKFPINFGIFDVSQFLNVIGIFNFEKLDMTFHDRYLLLTEGTKQIKYYYADTSTLTLPPEEDIECEPFIGTLKIELSVIKEILKISNIFNYDRCHFLGEEKTQNIIIKLGNSSEHNFVTTLESCGDITEDFDICISKSDLKIIESDYIIEFTPACLKFTYCNKDLELLEYFISTINVEV